MLKTRQDCDNNSVHALFLMAGYRGAVPDFRLFSLQAPVLARVPAVPAASPAATQQHPAWTDDASWTSGGRARRKVAAARRARRGGAAPPAPLQPGAAPLRGELWEPTSTSGAS